MEKLNLHFSHSFNGKIWNIISAADTPLILLEVRRHDQFLTSFFILDPVKGKFIIRDLEFEEKWWIGAAHLTGDVALFYTYDEQENPDSKDFFAYTIPELRILWQVSNKRLVNAYDTAIALSAPDEHSEELYDLFSGERIGNNAIKNDQNSFKNKLMLPSFHYREGTRHFETVSRFLSASIDIKATKAVDYFEDDHIMVMSYYYGSGQGKLANDLLVVDHKGEHLLLEKLGRDLPGISDNTFFVYNNKLIFVKNNTDFLIYQIA